MSEYCKVWAFIGCINYENNKSIKMCLDEVLSETGPSMFFKL